MVPKSHPRIQPLPPVTHTRLKDDLLALLLLGGCWIAMTVLANPLGNFPLNDDWVYAQAVQSVLDSGYYKFSSATSANVGPQIYWGALFCLPFGFSFTALRLSTLALGLIGVLVFYGLAQKISADRLVALTAAFVLATNPIYFGLANSFMTDIPFVVLVLMSTTCLLEGLDRRSAAWTGLGIALAFAAILVRQLGVVVLLAFAVAHLVKNGRSLRNCVNAAVLVTAGFCVHFGYQYWLAVTGRTPVLTVHADYHTFIPTVGSMLAMAKTVAGSLLYTGLFSAPFIALFWFSKAAGSSNVRLRKVWPALVYGLLALAGSAALWRMGKMLPGLGNVLIESGLGPLTLFDTYILQINKPVLPKLASIAWAGATLLALAAIFTAVHLMWSWNRSGVGQVVGPVQGQTRWKSMFFATMAFAYLGIMILISGRVPLYDRYFVFFLPLMILWLCNVRPFLLQAPRRAGYIAAALLILLSACFSVAATHDYLAWSRARWLALDDLMKNSDIRPEKIDGGYEFNGWFLYRPNYPELPNRSWWWVTDNEYIVASGPLPNYVEIGRYPFQRWLLGTESNILVLHRKK